MAAQVTGDLGNAGALEDLVRLGAPLYKPEVHGPHAGMDRQHPAPSRCSWSASAGTWSNSVAGAPQMWHTAPGPSRAARRRW